MNTARDTLCIKHINRGNWWRGWGVGRGVVWGWSIGARKGIVEVSGSAKVCAARYRIHTFIDVPRCVSVQAGWSTASFLSPETITGVNNDRTYFGID